MLVLFPLLLLESRGLAVGLAVQYCAGSFIVETELLELASMGLVFADARLTHLDRKQR